MKKKHRKIAYFILIGIPYIITLPFMCLGWTLEKLSIGLLDYSEWLKTKFRVYDTDPDYPPIKRVQTLQKQDMRYL